jgi:hypothetical protein
MMSCHVRSIFMGNIDVPTQNNQPLKMPVGTYEFGANLVSSKVRHLPICAFRIPGAMLAH